MNTIDDVENTAVVGNFDADSELWTACERIATNPDIPMDVRMRALTKIDQITGETDNPVTEDDVREYTAEVNSYKS